MATYLIFFNVQSYEFFIIHANFFSATRMPDKICPFLVEKNYHFLVIGVTFGYKSN